MEDNQYIKDILQKIALEDACAFSKFAQENPICFQEKKGNWLFPMMYEFYSSKIYNEKIISLLQELGLYMHNKCKKRKCMKLQALTEAYVLMILMLKAMY